MQLPADWTREFATIGGVLVLLWLLGTVFGYPGWAPLGGLIAYIGWHFFKEGAKKFHAPNFTANVFFEQAKGPLAPLFQMMVPDQTGRVRLDAEATKEAWQSYSGRVTRFFGFDQGQQKQAESVRKRWIGRLDQFHTLSVRLPLELAAVV